MAEPDEHLRQWLGKLRSGERNKAVVKAIDQALSADQMTVSSLRSALPVLPACEPVADQETNPDLIEVLQQNHRELLEEAARERVAESGPGFHDKRRLDALRAIHREELQSLVDILNGRRDVPEGPTNREWALILAHRKRIAARPDMGLLQVLRYLHLIGESGLWGSSAFQAWLSRQGPASVDLRQLGAAMERLKQPRRRIAMSCLVDLVLHEKPYRQLPAERVWPWFALHPEYIEEGLGLRPTPPGERAFDLAETLKVLRCFPALPSSWAPRLLQIALGETQTHRAPARALLSSQPDLAARVLDAAQVQKPDVRQRALRWLAELGDRDAAPSLRAMLAKETRELLRAELLSTLEALGADLSAELAPARLLAEAERCLSTGIPGELDWFDFDQLPSARWRDASVVAPSILRAWVVIAVRLKIPSGNPLLSRYLGLLDADSAAEFGLYVLARFIARDTIHPTLAEAQAHADAQVDQRLRMNLQFARQYPELCGSEPTRERAHAELVQEKLGVYLTSAIGAKGMLALIARIPGAELVHTVQAYMRDNPLRRAQIEALLEGLSQSDDPAAIQFLLAVSRRHRAASIQDKARQRVAAIAERLGWTPDVLADRTVPTAGLDERGEAELSFGVRAFKLKLDADLKLALYAEDGKPLKALPDPRKDEPAGVASVAKAQYSASKKELAQVLSQQQGRLYEAMCAGRHWSLADWRQYLAGHPIVGRLLQRLVWTAEADGQTWQFRPSEDGAYLGADDDELTLPAHAEISLAHAAVLSSDAVKRWLKHLQDYKIKPLFGQLDRSLPPTLAADAEQIEDRVGYCADAGGLRAILMKLGYQYASSGDSAHHKSFASAGIRVAIGFHSGSNVVALGALSFEALERGGRRIKPAEVPRILLAEAVADYHQAASIGAFDPQWEQRVAW
jgi:hypothetical protein